MSDRWRSCTRPPWPAAFAIFAAISCTDGEAFSPCEVAPFVGIASAWDSLAGGSFGAVGIDSVRVDGAAVSPQALVDGGSRRLYQGDGVLYCAIPCAFGDEPGRYEFRVRREDYSPASVGVSADPRGCAREDSLAAVVSVPLGSEASVRFRLDQGSYDVPLDWYLFRIQQGTTHRLLSGEALRQEQGELVSPVFPIRWDAIPVIFVEIRNERRLAHLIVTLEAGSTLRNRRLDVVIKVDTANPFPRGAGSGQLIVAPVPDLPGGTGRDSVFIVPFLDRIHEDWTW